MNYIFHIVFIVMPYCNTDGSMLFHFDSYGLVKVNTVSVGTMSMDSSERFHPNVNKRFKSLYTDPELLQIINELRELNRLHLPQVEKELKRAKSGTDKGMRSATQWLKNYIHLCKTELIKTDDPFSPYATPDQIDYGNIHILNQHFNNAAYNVIQHSFLYNGLILGRPKGGKSSAAYYILSQLNCPFLILDPKNMWRHRAANLNAKVIEPPFSLDITLPENVEWDEFLFGVMEGIAQITGLQYGLVPFFEAGRIALRQREEYNSRTGENTSVCIQDIYAALPLTGYQKIKGGNYLASAQTALQLILQPNNVFSTRQGLAIQEILNGRFIIDCHKLSAMQSRFLVFYLLKYILCSSYHQLESTSLKRLVAIDDSTSFINQPVSAFGTSPKTSFWMDLLSKLRGSGTGLLCIDQLIEPIFEDVKQLTSWWLVVGGLQDTHHFQEISSTMQLTQEQAGYLSKLQSQHAVAYFPNHYPQPVYGVIPEVPRINEEVSDG